MNGSENRRSGSNTSAFECCVLKVCAGTELSKLCNIQSSTNLTTNKSLHAMCLPFLLMVISVELFSISTRHLAGLCQSAVIVGTNSISD